MNNAIILLFIEAIGVYVVVLAVHSIRLRFGLGLFYAMLGGITAIMSWVTDTGIRVEAFGVSFLVGSAVFYTALMLGVFVVYVYDGPRSYRVAIYTVVLISILAPLFSLLLRTQLSLSGQIPGNFFPAPSLRINTASVITTIADLVFLVTIWEFLGNTKLKIAIWVRTFLALLGVLWFDSLLFNTLAFAGTSNYLSILRGSMLDRLLLSLFSFLILYAYLTWQNRKKGVIIEHRPVLSILKEALDGAADLDLAQREIERRQQTEQALRTVEQQYQTLFREMLNSFALHAIICDPQGIPKDYRFLAVNPAFERMTGLKADNIIGKTVLEVMPGTEPFWIETYGHVAITGTAAYFEHYAIELKKYFSVTAFRPAQNQFACFFEDITSKKEAEEAESKVKVLSGLLPICASCKHIRNDTGYWQSVESYISSHTQAEFTHGICPDCMKKLYPDLPID